MLKPEQVVGFLQHEDWVVRDLAAGYFQECGDVGPVRAMDAIDAWKRYPGGAFNALLALVEKLPATPACAWEMVRLLGDSGARRIRGAVKRGLAKLPMATLAEVGDALEKSKEIPEVLRNHIGFRRVQAEHPAKELLEKLEIMGQQLNVANETNSQPPFYPETAESVVAALGLHAGDAAARAWIMQRLENGDVDDETTALAAKAAGEVRLQEAVGPLMRLMVPDTDYLREQVVNALIRTGTGEVLREAEAMVAGQEWDVRLYAHGVFAGIKLPEAEEALLRLLQTEREVDLRTGLAHALGLQVSERGFPPVRAIMEGEHYDATTAALDETAYAMSVMLGLELPDSAKIRRRVESRHLKREKRAEMFGGWDDEDGEPPSDESLAAHTVSRRGPVAPGVRGKETVMYSDEKVGRNEPCPCGSGKKYKKCCAG